MLEVFFAKFSIGMRYDVETFEVSFPFLSSFNDKYSGSSAQFWDPPQSDEKEEGPSEGHGFLVEDTLHVELAHLELVPLILDGLIF